MPDPTTRPAGVAGAPADLRRRLGAFYTPQHATRYMAAMLTGLDDSSDILEPSGGDGAYVAALLETGLVRPDQIEVWDLDEAVGPVVEEFGIRFSCHDSLLDAPDDVRYSHIIGNPPYLNKQSQYVKANKARLRREYSTIGANDTYAMFIYMGLQRLLPGGQLTFLVSDTFLTLGIHRKLREHLLKHTRISSVTLLPANTFEDATVRTAIIDLRSGAAPDDHVAQFIDLRAEPAGQYDQGARYEVPQAEFATNQGSVFAFDDAQRAALRLVAANPPLTTVLDGGLGMHTGDNGAYLGVISRGGQTAVKPQAGMPTVEVDDIDGQTWRAYHKRGGSVRWHGPAEHCVRWDERSRSHYGIPASALVGQDPDGNPRPGFIVSGVAAALTARELTAGALWESNKAFGLFPKNPQTHPVAFFLAILNSTLYNTIARSLNHTVSFQARDLKALPLLPFTPEEISELTRLGTAAVEVTRQGQEVSAETTERIDGLVVQAAARATPAAGALAA